MNKFLKSIVNFLILTSVSQVVIAWSNTFSPRAEKNEPIKFALLIGGVVRDYDNHESFFANIVYVHKALKKLNYRDDNIKVLFFGGKKVNHSIIEGYATKKNFL